MARQLACCLGLLAAGALAATDPPSVIDLGVTADYHSVEVRWRYSGPRRPLGFSVGYCELQAWGSNRCKSKVIRRGVQEKEVDTTLYQATIGGLRMDTEYEFTVTPLDRRLSKERSQSASVQARTAAFSASTRCLGGASEVTVHTGPHFAGRLSVEDDPSDACGIQGDPDSDRQEYVLRIDHGACRTERSDTEVRTFVLVQEQDAIQTHSTRRFLVICNYQSDPFTVSAGVHLPRVPAHTAVGSQVQEVVLEPESRDPPRLVELGSRDGRQLIVSAGQPMASASRVGPGRQQKQTGGSWAQLVLMLVVVAAVVLGVAIGAIFSRRAALRRRQRSASLSTSSASDISDVSGASGGSDGRAAELPLELRRDGLLNPGRLAMFGDGYPSATC